MTAERACVVPPTALAAIRAIALSQPTDICSGHLKKWSIR
jgi:hypothetical protein